MRWQAAVGVLVALAVLWGLVRALRGGPDKTAKTNDPADRWLHAESDPAPPDQDAPVVDAEDAGSNAEGTEN